jgi:hypothetical protein
MPTQDIEKRRGYSADWYADNKSVAAERNRARRTANKRKIDEYKLAKGCAQCGYDRCAAALEAHHPAGTKDSLESTVALMAKRGRSWVSIEEELNKCEIVCANCHREFHAGL